VLVKLSVAAADIVKVVELSVAIVTITVPDGIPVPVIDIPTSREDVEAVVTVVVPFLTQESVEEFIVYPDPPSSIVTLVTFPPVIVTVPGKFVSRVPFVLRATVGAVCPIPI